METIVTQHTAIKADSNRRVIAGIMFERAGFLRRGSTSREDRRVADLLLIEARRVLRGENLSCV